MPSHLSGLHSATVEVETPVVKVLEAGQPVPHAIDVDAPERQKPDAARADHEVMLKVVLAMETHSTAGLREVVSERDEAGHKDLRQQ